jgi:23S rRNA (guanosine2251-2'-O)-methyltransferase
MRKLSHSEILAQRLTAEEALKAKRHPVAMILYNIRSLYNVGSIFRTADSALATELILCGYTPRPPRREISKTALGAEESVPWTYIADPLEAVKFASGKGYKVFALELTDSGRRYDELKKNDYPLCIIAGNELSGVDDELLKLCDGSLEIPMHGVKHSLNVSVAAGISLFEAVRIYRLFN